MRGYRAFIIMLKRTGVVFRLKKRGRERMVIIEATKGERNQGWEGLYTAFVFRCGSLVSVGVWDGYLAV